MSIVSHCRLPQLVVVTSVLHVATRPLGFHGLQNATDERFASDRNTLSPFWPPQ